jgi:hypothetical protein
MTYSVVVRDPNSWSRSTGIHCLLRDCGHQHRTVTGATACMDKLRNACCQHGSRIGTPCRECYGGRAKFARQWTANWYHACIEDSAGEFVEPVWKVEP